MINRRWEIAPGDDQAERVIAEDLNIDPVSARLLINRGITGAAEAESFLNPKLAGLRDPFEMASMDTAVERILLARERREKVTVFGDYDADGVTATAQLLKYFGELGIACDSYIPDRFTEGYGVNPAAIETIKHNGAGLVITVDNGANSAGAIERAVELGLDVIVTDHHIINGPLPPAVAVLNPMRDDCNYPFKGLCGAGVAFKLMTALRTELNNRGVPKEDLPNLRQYLSLVTLGTIADSSPLLDENRIIARHGLDELSRSKDPGVSGLKQISGSDNGKVTVRDVGYGLAPRINSAGRMAKAHLALELLMATGTSGASKIARELDGLNAKRKETQEVMFEQAVAMALESFDPARDRAIVLGSDEWSHGITGIVASKIVERFDAVAVLVGFTDGVGKGSARSVPLFDVNQCLKECSDELTRFGGHKGAAGLTVEKEKFEPFRLKFLAAAKQSMPADGAVSAISIDSQIDVSDITFELMNKIGALEPFGEGNPNPVFISKNVGFSGEPFYMGAEGKHVRLKLKEGSAGVQVVGFSMSGFFRDRNLGAETFDIVYTPEINTWQGRNRIQLKLIDVRQSS